ncbi:hypothetical protein [Phenylobacterium sp.]|jgi:hypothetical protein|uniref:hypothetical protein n=1 Tax=Phenylobacterium sp. TaxID=1871053 RepID=UPI002F943020
MTELIYFAEVILRSLPVERHRETYSRLVVALVDALEMQDLPIEQREQAEAARQALEAALRAPADRRLGVVSGGPRSPGRSRAGRTAR